MNVVAFCLMAAIIPSPATMRTAGDGFDDKVRHDEHLPTPLSKIDPFTCRDRHYRMFCLSLIVLASNKLNIN